MKVGVIGVGGMGQHHARVYSELGVLSCVIDTDEKRAREIASKYSVNYYSDIDVILKEKSLDAVTIAVPTPFHLQVAKKCFKAGINVLLEKPLSNSIEDAKEILKVARKYKKILATGYIERFNPAFLALQKEVDNKTFGEITSINIKRVGGIPRSADNVILDLMTHDFNLLMALFNKTPVEIYAHKHYRDSILDSAQVLLDFENASATCESNWISPIKIRQIHLTGTEGYCEVNLIEQKMKIIKDNVNTTISFNTEPLKQELINFIDAINGKTNYVTGEDALRTLEITLNAVNL